ncbi:MAG TPA: type II secretion system protein [Patescibacteria group bacterium]|nr:type II secretion system protein [Patescibacteria group bacterium]
MKNSKSEYRNPKQYLNSNIQKPKSFWKFGFGNSEFVSCFVFRALNFYGEFRSQSGQLLVEAVLAIALLGVLAGIIGMAVNVSTQSNKASGKKTVAVALAQEAIEAVRAIRDNNETTGRGWNKIYEKTEGAEYHVDNTTVAGKWTIQNNAEIITVDGVDYDRKIVFDMDIPRDLPNGGGNINAAGSADKSTIKATVTVTASGISAIIVEEYLTRAKNEVELWDTKAKFEAAGATCSSTHVNDSTGFVELKSGSGC